MLSPVYTFRPRLVTSVICPLVQRHGSPKEFAKQARIFDPRQVPNLPTNPAMYALIFPHKIRAQLVESGECALYKAALVKDRRDFDIH